MHFDKSDLQQLTPEYIARLPPERISILFNQLREDHLRALDRLNQNPTNSSRPPSSQAPWESSSSQEKDADSPSAFLSHGKAVGDRML